jgi:hypothetical protein
LIIKGDHCVGVIRQISCVRGDKGEEELSVLFDSGASRSLIRGDVAKRISTPRELLIERKFTVADGHEVICKYICDLVVKVGDKRIGIEAFIVDDLPVPLVFGALDMEAYMIKLDLARRRLDLSEFTGYMLAL